VNDFGGLVLVDAVSWKYSVIIPNFNSGELLPRMLDSIPVRNDIQIIVVDDISTDGSYEKWKAEPRYQQVRFMQAAKKVYAGGARNIGLSKAKGEYVLFADSDDIFSDRAFEIFDQEVAGEQDIILFRTSSFIEGTNKSGDRDSYRNKRLRLAPRQAALGAVGPVAKLVSNAFIRRHNLYFSEVIAANDIAFSIKAACLAETVKVVHQVVYRISQSENSLTATVSLEKSLSRVREQSKRIYLVRKYHRVAVFRYCLMHSLLFRFEAYARELHSEEFDKVLSSYKKELGPAICILSTIIDKIPFAVKSLNLLFRTSAQMTLYLKKNSYSRKD
jgi:glycosyltransferase involved in cell wall biosynthesis